jgi:hypothetical protein
MVMKIKMIVTTAHQAYLFKDQIELEGLRTDADYHWRYTPPVHTWLGDETVTPGTVEFDFQDDRWATYFQLKWAK